jgi:prepilin-type N-terminal cleavage/methylation domain-containing protein
MFKKIMNRKGFTLIELIVVIAIIAVLAAIIIPTVASSIGRANDSRDLANTRSALATFTVAVLSSESGDTAPTVAAVPGATTCVGTANMTDLTVTGFYCQFDTARFFVLNSQGEVVGPLATSTAP